MQKEINETKYIKFKLYKDSNLQFIIYLAI